MAETDGWDKTVFFLSFGGANMPNMIYCLVILFVILTPPLLLRLQFKSYTLCSASPGFV